MRIGGPTDLGPLFGQGSTDVQVFPAALYTVLITSLLTSMRFGTRTGLTTLYDVDVLLNARHGIVSYRLQSLTIVFPGRDDVFLTGIPVETRDAIVAEHPSFPHYHLPIMLTQLRLFQMSTVCSNALARYYQFVGERYLIPVLLAFAEGGARRRKHRRRSETTQTKEAERVTVEVSLQTTTKRTP